MLQTLSQGDLIKPPVEVNEIIKCVPWISMVNMRRVFIDLIHGQCSSQWGLIEFPQSMSFVRSLVPRPRTLPTTPKHLVAVCYMSLDTVASSDQSIPSESVLTTSRKPWVRPCTRPDQRRGLTTLNSSPALLPSCAIAVHTGCNLPFFDFALVHGYIL